VRNAHVVTARAAAGWTDASIWETARKKGAAAIRRLIDRALEGTSVTVALIGAETHKRKFVDWEIKATLDDEHGLIGVHLPTAVVGDRGAIIVPDRLHWNIQSGYALWTGWNSLTIENLRSLIAAARQNAANHKDRIVNPREIKQRND